MLDPTNIAKNLIPIGKFDITDSTFVLYAILLSKYCSKINRCETKGRKLLTDMARVKLCNKVSDGMRCSR